MSINYWLGNYYWEILGANENCEIYHDTMEILGITWLVVWNINFMTFHILGIIIPTD